ncbi:MAG: protein-L-isoaspartate O-methyltransferase [Candidatus Omnitrophica bacterium CG11_big_fil_rev_8_21_14_0_20_63_9]|nr:MAG: protein-L-isoaspartate O-methyltransferase [Candidatus Omnitrophica bacterium CG11_big_fil_rev_8_21_14_0_20_63_9]
MSLEGQRTQMVKEQLQARGIVNPRVLAAFRRVPRHVFVPPQLVSEAYTDHPLPIGGGQTISQPYMVALMTERLRLQGHERVLEIGTGSGYQAAILAELALEVYSVERLPELLADVSDRLSGLGYLNVHLAAANGSLGWPERAPYDAILVTAAVPRVPQPLIEQLAEGGRMVLPVGPAQGQVLMEVHKRGGTVTEQPLIGCVFVPLIGEYGWPAGGEAPAP